jgi:hypothetical protein
MLCAVFGAVAAQGVLRAAPAQAHGQEPEPQTAASAELARMADYYNQLLDTDQPILYLDPDRLQTLPQEPTFDDLARMIGRDGVTPTLDALERLDSSITTTPGPYSAVNADYGLEHELLMPYALAGLPSDGGTFCLAVAGVDHAVVRGLDGMTAEQAVRFFNRHEFWHCVGDTVLEAHGAARDGSERRFTRAFYEHKARVLSSETMADLGAVADMIAEDGDGLEIVQSVSIWRARRFFAEQRDIDHFSSPALIVFAQEIEAMGIDAFRQRGAAARLEMITRSTRENRISPAVLALLDQHRHGVNADHMRPSASERALAEKVAGLMRQVGSITHDDFEFIVLSEDQGAELARFDARGRLERAARGEAEGPLSRHAVLAARARLLDELRRALRETPDDPLIGARIILTHRAAAGLLHDAATETSSYRPATVGAGHPVAGS